MNRLHHVVARLTALSTTLSLAACVTGSATSRAMPIAHANDTYLLMNGQSVGATHQSLLDILVAKQSAHRIGLNAPLPEQPLVLIDGARVIHGFQALATIPAFHVRDVEVLQRLEAAARYGSRARHGAIVVTTR